MGYNNLSHFKFWCQKVLPLVYDDSLSYYEVLCKLTDYINDMIDNNTTLISDVEQLKQEMSVVQEWIKNFDTTVIEELVNEYIGKAVKNVVFGISSSGYFVASIPNNWSDIAFGTIQNGELYGHLTLSYD